MHTDDAMLKGDPLTTLVVHRDDLEGARRAVSRLMGGELSILIIREAIEARRCQRGANRLLSAELEVEFSSPNKGMLGGELQTIGAAATPCMTALQGPDLESYQQSAARADAWERLVFDDHETHAQLKRIFSAINEDKPAQTPALAGGEGEWLPFNYRVMPEGVQIYAHHDRHYRLPIYEQMDERYDRDVLMSWFVTLQEPAQGGELIVYGLRSDDPDPPMLPTRFVDAAALDRGYHVARTPLKTGDLILFNSGVYVHRVTPVEREIPRVTLGGFFTVDRERTHSIYWS